VRELSVAGKATKSAAASLEDALWESANQLRSSMDAAEYKHVVLGLIFLKYVSDVFEKQRLKLDELSCNESTVTRPE
jgi:type I restriction enzyme M protein